MNLTSTTTINNNSILRSKTNATTNQACAACKYQRRKCEPNCLLAPYFPHNRQTQFLNAHRLFGVSNIKKIVQNLSQADKDEAMKSIIFESDVRANDPVGGCYRIIRELQFMIDYCQSELDFVLHQISVCKAQQTQAQVVSKDEQEHDQQRHVAFVISDDQAPNNNSSDPDSDVINANPFGVCSYSQPYSYRNQSHLRVKRTDQDDDVGCHASNNHYDAIQDDENLWVQHEEEENEQQDRMITSCIDRSND